MNLASPLFKVPSIQSNDSASFSLEDNEQVSGVSPYKQLVTRISSQDSILELMEGESTPFLERTASWSMMEYWETISEEEMSIESFSETAADLNNSEWLVDENYATASPFLEDAQEQIFNHALPYPPNASIMGRDWNLEAHTLINPALPTPYWPLHTSGMNSSEIKISAFIVASATKQLDAISAELWGSLTRKELIHLSCLLPQGWQKYITLTTLSHFPDFSRRQCLGIDAGFTIAQYGAEGIYDVDENVWHSLTEVELKSLAQHLPDKWQEDIIDETLNRLTSPFYRLILNVNAGEILASWAHEGLSDVSIELWKSLTHEELERMGQILEDNDPLDATFNIDQRIWKSFSVERELHSFIRSLSANGLLWHMIEPQTLNNMLWDPDHRRNLRINAGEIIARYSKEQLENISISFLKSLRAEELQRLGEIVIPAEQSIAELDDFSFPQAFWNSFMTIEDFDDFLARIPRVMWKFFKTSEAYERETTLLRHGPQSNTEAFLETSYSSNDSECDEEV